MAVLCLVGQVGTLVHRALVRHATCAEHGELTHPADVARADRYPASDPRASELRSSTSTSSDHDDDHCLVAGTAGRVSFEGPRLAVRVDLVISAVAPPADVASPPPSVALFLLAPKNSPPA